MRSREGRGDRGLHGLDATAQGFGTLHVLRRDALHAQEQGCPVVPDAGAQLALSGFDPRGEGRHVRRTSIRFDGIHPERDLQHDHFVRHQRGDGRRAARDRNEGDRRDRRQRPQERRHREKPRVHAQELEKQPRTECQLDELPQQQIRLRARLPGRLRRGAQDADRRRRTGHGQEGAFRR